MWVKDGGINTLANNENAVGRDTALNVATPDPVAGDPDFVHLISHRLDPGTRQAAELPRLHEHPMAERRWLETRWPLMPHIGIHRLIRRFLKEHFELPTRSGLHLSRIPMPGSNSRQLVPAQQQLPTNRAVDQCQRMDLLVIAFPYDV